jgi:hypothetical protein
MSFCPKCGFNVDDLTDPLTRLADDHRGETTASRRANPSLILAALIVAAGLIGYGLVTRASPTTQPPPGPDGSGAPISLAPGATAPPSAPIIGMTIQSPRDGEQVFTKQVTVVGLAPPGTRITRDVSLRPDQHATADSTGHWAIGVDLDEGGNTLVFRIGDDRSTEQRIRVTYTPPTS